MYVYIIVLKTEHKIVAKVLTLNFEIPFKEGPTLILIDNTQKKQIFGGTSFFKATVKW